MASPVTLIGQHAAETLLARAVLRGQVGHAYLLLGPSGSGKATAARLFAQAVNCERQPAVKGSGFGVQGSGEPPQPPENRGEFAGTLPAPDALGQELSPSPSEPQTLNPEPSTVLQLNPCGVCESCRRILAGTHPEVIEVRPASKSGQNISVDQAREIRRNAALRPKMGHRRFYLIPNAEAFNEESGNALLKTLEEPSPFVTLVLCAPSPSLVLPTIRSRCQIVRFGLADPAEISTALTQRGVGAERAEALARASGGRPGLALSWADDPEVLEARGRVLEIFAAAVGAQPLARRDPSQGIRALRLAEQLRVLVGKEKDADDDRPTRPAKVLHSENLEIGLTYLRDLLLLTGGAEGRLLHNADRLPQLQEQAAATTAHRALTDIDTVREAQQLLERNTPPQLVFERMFWSLIVGSPGK